MPYASRAIRRLRRAARRIEAAWLARVARCGVWVLGALSLERALQVTEAVAVVVYSLARTSRRLATEHVSATCGEGLTPAARAHLARAAFVNVARCWCELAKIDAIRARKDAYFQLEGWEDARPMLLGAGKGALLITGNAGNWELVAAYFAWNGIPVAALGRRLPATWLNAALVDLRRRQGVHTVFREHPNATRELLRALQANALLAMPIDPDAHAPATALPFLGRQAHTPAAAAALAIRRDLPVAAAFIQRRPEGGHRISIGPPFEVPRTGDMQADIRALARQFSLALEGQMRKNPAEWMGWHRR